MSKEITISIDKNGLVKSHIAGTPGRKCMNYLELLEKIVGGEIISHQFTEEYYQNEQEINKQQQSEQTENKI